MCTRRSRKVIWDMINTPFQTLQLSKHLFLLSFSTCKHIRLWSLVPLFQISLKNSELRQPFSKQLYTTNGLDQCVGRLQRRVTIHYLHEFLQAVRLKTGLYKEEKSFTSRCHGSKFLAISGSEKTLVQQIWQKKAKTVRTCMTFLSLIALRNIVRQCKWPSLSLLRSRNIATMVT